MIRFKFNKCRINLLFDILEEIVIWFEESFLHTYYCLKCVRTIIADDMCLWSNWLHLSSTNDCATVAELRLPVSDATFALHSITCGMEICHTLRIMLWQCSLWHQMCCIVRTSVKRWAGIIAPAFQQMVWHSGVRHQMHRIIWARYNFLDAAHFGCANLFPRWQI